MACYVPNDASDLIARTSIADGTNLAAVSDTDLTGYTISSENPIVDIGFTLAGLDAQTPNLTTAGYCVSSDGSPTAVDATHIAPQSGIPADDCTGSSVTDHVYGITIGSTESILLDSDTVSCANNYSGQPQLTCTTNTNAQHHPNNPTGGGAHTFTFGGCTICSAGQEGGELDSATNRRPVCENCGANKFNATAGESCKDCKPGSLSSVAGYSARGTHIASDPSGGSPGAGEVGVSGLNTKCVSARCSTNTPPGYKLVKSDGTEYTQSLIDFQGSSNLGSTWAVDGVFNGANDQFRLSDGTNRVDVDCKPGYIKEGNPTATGCTTWDGEMSFQGCVPSSGSQNYDSDSESLFDSDFDGSLDVAFKHIAGGVFVAFLGISIMGIIKKKTKE